MRVKPQSAAQSAISYVMDRISPCPNTGCWWWMGTVRPSGYGSISKGRLFDRGMNAHRAVYKVLVGPVDDHRDVHHRCNNPTCVNPDHLEPILRMFHLNRWAAANQRRRHRDWLVLKGA